MTTTRIKCSLDGGRVQFYATVDDNNKWTISKEAPRNLADNLLPDFKRAASTLCADLVGQGFERPSQRYAARAIYRLKYMFSGMEVAPPAKRGRPRKKKAEIQPQPENTPE